ncbi:MAG: hypothetical protein FWC95_01070 [Defluviitaleaceae bacterium]|nr:hypothetical protein [Defluviitaleaceae bacterium]
MKCIILKLALMLGVILLSLCIYNMQGAFTSGIFFVVGLLGLILYKNTEKDVG